MVVQQDQRVRKLSGSASEQELAGVILNVLLARGMFMSANAVIRMPVSMLAEYASSQGKTGGDKAILEAAAANPDVFAVDATGEEPMILTMRDGRAPVAVETVSASFLRQPFPDPKTAAGALAVAACAPAAAGASH